ncbi:MAG: NAD(P)/FAD-dependent oxidoreductase [Candidatus Hydrogenedentota bacterium]
MQNLEADYLVIGAGAMGLAFIDEVATRDRTATFILVDKRSNPGGHWNDAYSFVTLHQPAAFYGVNSMVLGRGGASLASGVEVLAYYDRVMTKLLETGRVQYFPMCVYEGDRKFSSMIDAECTYEVKVGRRTVDASYMNVQVPATTPPKYQVSSGVELVPLNDLVKIRKPHDGYVIVGAGKTGIDAVLFLLEQNVDPKRITWIVSNDSWLLDRGGLRPGITFQWFLQQVRAITEADSLNDVTSSLEAEKVFFRIDPSIEPTKFRCATVDREELAQLRRIENVVRMGRVVQIDPGMITLEQGTFATPEDVLHVDCTADPLAKRPVVPVFEGSTITLQSLSMCQQVFSASLIGYLECRFDDDVTRNALSHPVPHPEFTRDYIPAVWRTLANLDLWMRKLGRWMRTSRLAYSAHDSIWSTLRYGLEARYLQDRAFESMRKLYGQEFPGETFEGDV